MSDTGSGAPDPADSNAALAGAPEDDSEALTPGSTNAGTGSWTPEGDTSLKSDFGNAGLQKFDESPSNLDPDWGNAGLKLNGSISTALIAPPSQSGVRLNTNIGINVFFTVTIDAVDLGAWSKCTGIGMKINTVDRDESGMTLFQHHLPGHLVYEHITLERPLTRDCRAVMSWFTTYHMIPIPTAGQITCVDQTGAPLMSWEMGGVTPVAWKGPTLDATAGSALVATEQLTFAHTGFL
jgi:phage tail-like protein